MFGILTRPTGPANGIAVAMCTGGGHLTLTHRNRMFVRLARTLAGRGYHALRFDFHGTGESTGLVERFRLDSVFTEDLAGALAFLVKQGLERHVLVGTCFGARTALSLAGDAGSATGAGIEGVAMVSPPIRDQAWGDPVAIRRALRSGTARRLGALPGVRAVALSRQGRAARTWAVTNARRMRDRLGARDRRLAGEDWVSPAFLQPLQGLVARRLPFLLSFGDQDEMFADFQQARSGRLGEALAAAGHRLDFRVLPGRVHGFESLGTQEAVIGMLTEWLSALRPQAAGA